MTRVAPLKTTGQKCLVCVCKDEVREAINAAIWDGDDSRVRGYRAKAQRVYERGTGKSIDPKSITRHADHTEATWHDADGTSPPTPDEIPVFATDYEGLTDQAAHLSAQAMGVLKRRTEKGLVEDRDLVSLAKIGVAARSAQEANRLASKRPQVHLAAIIGVASGGMGTLPEYEAIDVTPTDELHREVEDERAALKAIAAVPQGSDGESEADALGAVLEP